MRLAKGHPARPHVPLQEPMGALLLASSSLATSPSAHSEHLHSLQAPVQAANSGKLLAVLLGPRLFVAQHDLHRPADA